jgi:hypothetical protein
MMPITVKSVVILVVCIVAANLLLAALRMAVDIPFSDGLESAIATGVGVLAWFFVSSRMKAGPA